VDVDLRKVRYFVAVAEHLNFGRAAQALHIAQPVLSRQIRALEQELKVQLFERDKRATRLTPAGQALLEDGRALLAAADAARRRIADVAAGERVFTVGFMPGLIVTAAVSEFSRRHPDVTVEVLRTDWINQTDVIHDGTVDVGYLRLPVELRGLTTEPLLSEQRVAVVPAGHRLAGKDSVVVADLAAEHLLQDPEAVPEWRDIAVELRDGQPPGRIPFFRTVEEKLEHVAAGHGIVVLPLSTATFYTRADISHVLVGDIAPNQVCLAWDSLRHSPLIGDYVAIARTVCSAATVPAARLAARLLASLPAYLLICLFVAAQVGAEEPDQVLAGQGGGADAAEEEDQHPDRVEVGLDQPEHADHQPEQDDQGHRADVSGAHVLGCHFCENVAGSHACTRSAVAVHIA
jgi:DNA-binding transcriptional LysR family regulator